MLNFTDFLNERNVLTEDCIFVSFDTMKMFPSLNNQSGLRAVENTLEVRQQQFQPTNCITEALKLCLESKNSVFNKKCFRQTDGNAQGPYISCSYSDIVIESFYEKVLHYHLSVIGWK